MKDNWIYYEDPYIYDGWILQFNTTTRKIKWRDFWVVDNLTKEKKDKIEENVRKIIFSWNEKEGN